MNNFNEDLQYSFDKRDKPFWYKFYKKAFPTLMKLWNTEMNDKFQRMGIDTVVKLSNGKLIYIDEKKRREDYGDMLLERISNNVTNTPGWMEKDLSLDYIAYAVIPTETVYLYPWDLLKLAWNENKEQWIQIYPRIPAENEGYTTISVAVPFDVLNKAVTSVSIIKVE